MEGGNSLGMDSCLHNTRRRLEISLEYSIQNGLGATLGAENSSNLPFQWNKDYQRLRD
jgi:hypothetical protein